MFLDIPATVADIQSSQKSNLLINDHNFLMMTPQERNQ